ncbi:phosphotriesterase [Kineococcus sp. SYSU DK006]|uniref:phosphotriesterase family protein n=1 Tax=Kineococcus sp. SYSU DK006 TaxID=3383127 RepID=UPI003D7DBA07
MNPAPAHRVRTVLGDVDPAALGRCDAHDHLFLASRLLPGEELGDEGAARAELLAWAGAGGGSLVQWTPRGLRRRADRLPALSRATGVHLVAATGLHQQVHHDPRQLRTDLPHLADRFVADLTTGTTGGGVRAGLVKVAAEGPAPDAVLRHVLRAAAQACAATGAPVAVHLEAVSDPRRLLDELGGHGVPPGRVLFGHPARPADPAAVPAVVAAGASVVLDAARPGRPGARTWALLRRLLDAGHADRLLVGADTTTASARRDGSAAQALQRFHDRLVREHGARTAEAVLTRNPARALAAAWAP